MTRKCLDVANFDGYGEVSNYYCEARPDQWWFLYGENYILN